MGSLWHIPEFHFPRSKRGEFFVADDAKIQLTSVDVLLNNSIGFESFVDIGNSVIKLSVVANYRRL